MVHLGITLFIGGVFGFLLFKLRVPGGMMVGALLAVSVLSVCTDWAYMPSYARVAAQITAGAFIACTVEKSDLKRLPHIVKPAAILLGGMLCLNLLMGFLIHAVTDLDWITSFMCAVPGGMSDTPIIAADMGGNGGKVAVMQFARLLTGIGVFPSLILTVTKKEAIPQQEARVQTHSSGGKHPAEFILTVVVAGVFGVIGKLSGVPVGALLFALIGVIALKLLFDRAYLPMWMKRAGAGALRLLHRQLGYLAGCGGAKGSDPCGDLTFTGLYGCLPGDRTRDGQNLRNEPTGIHVGGYSGRSQPIWR